MHPFRKAVEDHDEAAIQALLADDVVFTSPVAFKPYVGKPITAAILRGVLRVFEDFRYVREIHDSNGRDHAFVFESTVATSCASTMRASSTISQSWCGRCRVRPHCPRRWAPSSIGSSRKPSN